MSDTSGDSKLQIHFARTAAVGALVAALVAPTASLAVEYTAARKLGRGVAGMTLGFLEVPGNMVALSRESGPATGIPLGFALGLGKLVARELIGVYEFLSAPFSAPAGFVPILEPEFPWDYFESSSAPAYSFTSSGRRALEQIPGVVVSREASGLRIRLPSDLLFETGRSALSPSAKARLSKVASALREHPASRVSVQGFTDSTGGLTINMLLSEARAAAVRNYLMEQGIAPTRISSAGYGAQRPIASNDTSQGRQSNRRVELELRTPDVAAFD